LDDAVWTRSSPLREWLPLNPDLIRQEQLCNISFLFFFYVDSVLKMRLTWVVAYKHYVWRGPRPATEPHFPPSRAKKPVSE
jgi:hypothetical protein